MKAFCRDCLSAAYDAPEAGRCADCGSPRILAHPELDTLSIAHIDCDAFYAAVEKRDNPALQDKPLIIGGGRRGVVSTACYIARMYGIHSAMPMFKALKRCPEAVVLRPDMRKYSRVSRDVRQLMAAITPLVEPISIDEAFLDLAGTTRLHHMTGAASLARLARTVEREIGITLSIGLSYNKFLAKLASDLDKPRGFAVIGRADAMDFLAGQPIARIWGVGKSLEKRLLADGIRTIGALRNFDERELIARYGAIGQRLWRFAHGIDARAVDPRAEPKSISTETTFDEDIADGERLARILWPLCESVAARLKRNDLAGRTITLKLKTADFATRTRSSSLPDATQLAEIIYQVALPMLRKEAMGTRFRLIGIGVSQLVDDGGADPPNLLNPEVGRIKQVEGVIDVIRQKFGPDAIGKGRSEGKRRH